MRQSKERERLALNRRFVEVGTGRLVKLGMSHSQREGRIRSIFDLLLALTLLAIGFGAFAWFNMGVRQHRQEWWGSLIPFSAGAIIGTGLLAPFKKKTLGAVLGLMLISPACGLFLDVLWPLLKH